MTSGSDKYIVCGANSVSSVIEELKATRTLSDPQLLNILSTDKYDQELFSAADEVRRSVYGDRVFIRGLIEITNYCRNDCYYCGIRRSNEQAERYRLSADEIFSCCQEGYALGFRTFVLQGGEDAQCTDEFICGVTARLHDAFPDCAITLSLGERPESSYRAMYSSGARRYLLRHETADFAHYAKLHPSSMSLENRMKCLSALKKIGFQTGDGFMTGAPFQTAHHIVKDIRFMQALSPDMIGIGPFIHHRATPFAHCPDGTLSLTLRLIAILRLMFPEALIPSTTALATLCPEGRILGLKAGANVVMPNLSPLAVRKKYELYENKAHGGMESAQELDALKKAVKEAGYKIVVDKGDRAGF